LLSDSSLVRLGLEAGTHLSVEGREQEEDWVLKTQARQKCPQEEDGLLSVGITVSQKLSKNEDAAIYFRGVKGDFSQG
jgi:hypothetical protein